MHAQKGQDNFNKIRTDPHVEFSSENGFDTIPTYADSSIDLLFLDANGFDPTTQRNSKNLNYIFLLIFFFCFLRFWAKPAGLEPIPLQYSTH